MQAWRSKHEKGRNETNTAQRLRLKERARGTINSRMLEMADGGVGEVERRSGRQKRFEFRRLWKWRGHGESRDRGTTVVGRPRVNTPARARRHGDENIPTTGSPVGLFRPRATFRTNGSLALGRSGEALRQHTAFSQ